MALRRSPPMKNIWTLSLLALFGASLAQAADRSVFSMSFFGNYGVNYTMVSCDYAESVAEETMTKLGATKIETYCSGGITPFGVYPINLRAEYDAPIVNDESTTQLVEIENGSFGGNCVFDTALMSALLVDFTNVKVVSKRDFCFQADSSYSYKLEVTK
jgi:hypothetical protein